MNLNNHLKETPSVKMHNPPGGKSNFSLGWDVEEKPAKNNVSFYINRNKMFYNNSLNNSLNNKLMISLNKLKKFKLV